MPTMYIPDELFVRIIRVSKEDYKQFIREAIKEKLEREEREDEVDTR